MPFPFYCSHDHDHDHGFYLEYKNINADRANACGRSCEGPRCVEDTYPVISVNGRLVFTFLVNDCLYQTEPSTEEKEPRPQKLKNSKSSKLLWFIGFVELEVGASMRVYCLSPAACGLLLAMARTPGPRCAWCPAFYLSPPQCRADKGAYS